MTNEFLQQKFSELIYHLGECEFDGINNDFWNKHINNNEPFSEKQIEIFKDFSKEIIMEELSELSKKYIK